jgi:hypothetical protein
MYLSGRWKKTCITVLMFFGMAGFSFSATFPAQNRNLPQGREGQPYFGSLTIALETTEATSTAIAWTDNLPLGSTSVSTDQRTLFIAIPSLGYSQYLNIRATPNVPATATPATYAAYLDIRPHVVVTSGPQLADGIVGEPYNQTLHATPTASSWAVVNPQNLPPGLRLEGSNIVGTPVSTGEFTFQVIAHDSNPPNDYSDPTNLIIRIGPAPYTPIGNNGQLLYVKNVIRDTDGTITSTGDLFIKNLATGIERQITNYFDPFTILNPQFSPDGSEVLYTAKIANDPFKIYKISSFVMVSDPNTGVLIEDTSDLKYASLSSDYDGKTGLLVYTKARPGGTDLYRYDFARKDTAMIFGNTGFEIRNPIFVDSTRIAFVGIVNMVQDIYSITADGQSVKLTNNTANTPQYSRLMTSSRAAVAPYPLLLYSKRTYGQFNYGQWDVYIRTVTPAGVPSTEYNITNTPTKNELDPAFYGDALTSPPLNVLGQIFYSADIVDSSMDIWQANYDIDDPSDSNTSRLQRTTLEDNSLPVWSPIPTVISATEQEIDLANTRFIFATPAHQIARADGENFSSSMMTITSAGSPKSNPTMARNGGTILYTMEDAKTSINSMNHDGSNDTSFAEELGHDIDNAVISNDGRWVAYVQQTGTNQSQIYMKKSSDILGSGTPILPTPMEKVSSPNFNPGMSKIAFSAAGTATKRDIYTIPITIDNLAGTVTPGAGPINLTNSSDIDDYDPAFSNDGSKIIHISDRWNDVFHIFTMRTDGTSIERVVENTTGISTFRFPIYGPINAGTSYTAGTDMIAFVQDNTIHYASLYRNNPNNPPAGTNPVISNTSTGIPVNPDEKFAWGIKREKGTVLSSRILPKLAPAGNQFTYDVVIDVDEAAKPNGFILNEFLPAGFTIADTGAIILDGGTLATYQIDEDTPHPGLTRVSLLFGLQNDGVKDNLLRITVTSPSALASQFITGNVSYNLGGENITYITTGTNILTVGTPFMPVDLFDERGLPRSEFDKGIIDDFDLLYAIDSWVIDATLEGYGAGWPASISHWDSIVLAVIDIWASPKGTSGFFGPVAIPNFTGQADPSKKAGEYSYIPSISGAQPGDVYKPEPGTGAGIEEMFWTQGEWQD